jgi:hypothetical protein
MELNITRKEIQKKEKERRVEKQKNEMYRRMG